MGSLWRRMFRGSAIALIGFLLSPLSWWNDLFVNIPIALGVAWVIGWIWPKAFTTVFVLAYWATNVLGLVLLRRGTTELLSKKRPGFSAKEILVDLAVALTYTIIVLLLAKWRILQPLQDYFINDYRRDP
ncbi:MAG: hypothetical protein N3G20_07715 [Verrucomicrobiae bacterium]|nr:hypothetical protein [Verrucomicrobiae bacterium]